MKSDLKSYLLPYLKAVANSREWSFQELVETLATKLNVSNDERLEMIPSGQKIFDYHVGWARTFLKKAGLVESTRHGFVRITQKGLNVINKNPDINDDTFLRQFPIFIESSSTETKMKKSIPIIKTQEEKVNRLIKENKHGLDLDYIQGLGNLLTYYHSDLTYIRDFHRYKDGKIATDDYLKKSIGTFRSFINEFRVARNIDKTKTNILLQMTITWISSKNSTDVDGFAESLRKKGITHGKVMTSLASKILFLNNPWIVLPLDNRAKKSLGLLGNQYVGYLPIAKEYAEKNEIIINRYLNSVDQHLTNIETDFITEIKNIKTIRLNRFVDKILWTSGRFLKQ